MVNYESCPGLRFKDLRNGMYAHFIPPPAKTCSFRDAGYTPLSAFHTPVMDEFPPPPAKPLSPPLASNRFPPLLASTHFPQLPVTALSFPYSSHGQLFPPPPAKPFLPQPNQPLLAFS